MTTSVQLLFGDCGEAFRQIGRMIIPDVVGTKYVFMNEDDFTELPPAEAVRVYWTEMLYRVHWAAASNLLRHKRWFDSCVLLFESQPNYLGFCASLRSLTEGAADASYSLRGVPFDLAENYRRICTALSGKATSAVVFPTLEDSLIHFQFARKLGKSEAAPPTHKAEHLTTYISSIDQGASLLVADLYSELCQITHPACQSMLCVISGAKIPKITGMKFPT